MPACTYMYTFVRTCTCECISVCVHTHACTHYSWLDWLLVATVTGHHTVLFRQEKTPPYCAKNQKSGIGCWQAMLSEGSAWTLSVSSDFLWLRESWASVAGVCVSALCLCLPVAFVNWCLPFQGPQPQGLASLAFKWSHFHLFTPAKNSSQ